MFNSFSDFVIYFMFYSFLGWICEELYCSIPAKKFVNRGFLAGPYLPIYGFGAILILMFLKPFSQDFSSVFMLFIASVFVTSTLEYITSVIMEKVFSIRWWDYSHKKFNLHGRICLENSILFGLLGVILVHIVNPFAIHVVTNLSTRNIRVISSLFISVLLIDFTTTLNSMYNLEEKAKKLKNILSCLEKYNTEYDWLDRNNIAGSIDRLERICTSCNDTDSLKFVEQLRNMFSKDKIGARLLNAFPKLTHSKLDDNFLTLKNSLNEIHEKAEQIKDKFSSRVWKQVKHFYNPVDETIDIPKEKSFAYGVNFYKIFWIFFIGSILGFFVETLFCFYRNGYIESRQGLLYGPFSQIYGFGAVLLTILLRKTENRSDRFIFIYSAFIGGVYEFLSSVFQEFVFGTVSWQYGKESYGIAGGRTSLLYMLFWGVLGTVFIKIVYPRLSKFIEKLPNSGGKLITWILFVLLLADGTLSCAALYRWKERTEGKPATNAIATFIDNHYNDAMMQQIYSSMVPANKN